MTNLCGSCRSALKTRTIDSKTKTFFKYDDFGSLGVTRNTLLAEHVKFTKGSSKRGSFFFHRVKKVSNGSGELSFTY